MTLDHEPLPPESSDEWVGKNVEAMFEFINRLHEAKYMTFAELDEIAIRHGTVTAAMLAHAEQSADCVIDYAESLIKCT